jgi:hypothetical protein
MLLGVPVAVLVGRGIALGSRSVALAAPSPSAVTSQPQQRGSAGLTHCA